MPCLWHLSKMTRLSPEWHQLPQWTSTLFVHSVVHSILLAVCITASSGTLRPSFKPTAQNVTVGVGERAVLKCRVENLGTRTVTWRRQGETHPLTIGVFTFAPDPRLTVDFNQRTSEWSLIIPEVRTDDEGLYHCQVTVKAAPLQNSYDVRLIVRTIQLSGTEYVEVGSPIRLLCNASGKSDPPSNIEWFFERQPLYSDVTSGLFVTTKVESKVLFSMVLIQRSNPRHQGVYVCRAANGDSTSMAVYVLNGISAERIIGGNEQLPASSTGTALFTHHPYQIATLSIWILTLDHLFRLLNFHQYYEFCRITSSY